MSTISRPRYRHYRMESEPESSRVKYWPGAVGVAVLIWICVYLILAQI